MKKTAFIQRVARSLLVRIDFLLRFLTILPLLLALPLGVAGAAYLSVLLVRALESNDKTRILGIAIAFISIGLAAWRAELTGLLRTTRKEMFEEAYFRPCLGNPEIIGINDLRDIEKSIRAMIEHENSLMNNRIQWLLTITGFILTALFLPPSLLENRFLVFALASLGLIVSASFALSLAVGREAVGALLKRWQFYSQGREDFFEVGVLGSKLKGKLWNRLVPWWILPPVLMLFWCSVAISALTMPENIKAPIPGRFAFVDKEKAKDLPFADTCKTMTFYFNTTTGDLHCLGKAKKP